MSSTGGVMQSRFEKLANRVGQAIARYRLPYVMFLPTLLLVVGLMFYPLIVGILLSFQDKYLLSREASFVGLENFRRLLTMDQFWNALRNSLSWTIMGVVGQLAIGLILALALNMDLPGRKIFRTLLLFPWVMPTFVTGTIWQWLFNDVYGHLNAILMKLGFIRSPVLWLADPDIVLYSVTMPLVWRGYPFVMLVFLASLQSIDKQLYEAAEIDGAGLLQQFRYVTLPGIKPSFAIVTLLEFIWVFNHFDLTYFLTRGGPGHASELLSTMTYLTAFEGFRASFGSTIAAIQFVILLILGTLYLRYYGLEN